MKKKVSKVVQKKPNFQEEVLILGHLIKYNLYLLSKAVVFNAVLQKEGDINKAANYTHAIMMAFHDQDHRDVPEKTTGESGTVEQATAKG